jgi:tetratricopeptide (TPR) repeat protein
MATKTAYASLEERLQANPDSLSFSRLAEHYRTSGDLEKAVSLCLKGNELHPDYVTGRIVLGRCYADLENFESAVEALSCVCRIDRRNTVAMKMLADIFVKLGAREKAGDLYALLAVMDPWNETVSRMAALTHEPGAALKGALGLQEILGAAPAGEALELHAEQVAAEKEPIAAIDDAAQRAVTQEVTKLELGITESAPVAKDDAVLETSENIPEPAEQTLFEASTVTGTDITDRMAMLFGEAAVIEKHEEEQKPQDQTVFETAATDENIVVETVKEIPDGGSITSRIDEMFSKDPLKIPAVNEQPFSPDGFEAEDTILKNEPESIREFEETMIMDAREVKDLLQEEPGAPDNIQKTLEVTEHEELIIDDHEVVAEMATPTELIVDEKEPDAGESTVTLDRVEEDLLAASVVEEDGDMVTGDDVARQLDGLFSKREEDAILEIIGPEANDGFFEEAVSDEGKKEPDETGPVTVPLEENIVINEQKSTVVATDDTISGDDVVERIEGYFGETATGTPLTPDSLLTTTAAALPQGDIEEDDREATIFESDIPAPDIVTNEPVDKDAVGSAEGTVSGDDVAERIAGMFDDAEEESGISVIATPPEDVGAGGVLGIDDTRMVEAGRPLDTGVIEDTVIDGGGIMTGSDIEERIEEYFHVAVGPGGKKGTPIDKKDDFEETVDSLDPYVAGLSIDSMEGSLGRMKSLREVPGSEEETFPGHPDLVEESVVPDLPIEQETIAGPGKEDDIEATAVFTDFTPESVEDAPPVPPEVPLFTIETPRPRDRDEESVINVVPEATGPDEPAGPDIPDHVLTPTLADIYLQQGQPKLALTIYRRLFDKKPDDKKLAERIVEIEKGLSDGTLPVMTPLPAAQAQKPATATGQSRKKSAGNKTARRKPPSEDNRPLAGVRLKKRPGMNWKKK